MNADALQNLLTPDDDDANFVVSGFRRGFQLGYEGPKISRNCNNSTLANANPLAVAQKLQSEIKLGRIAGPYPKPPFTPFICNPLSLREKSEKGKYRLLHDLSYPHNELSVNANIPEDYAKVKYATVRDAITLISKYKSPFLAKSDIAEAYRIVPLRKEDYWLTGMKFKGEYYYDKCLVMGARSSCHIFEKVSSALARILATTYRVTEVVKVLDDFLFIGNSRKECRYALECFRSLCRRLGVPLAEKKTEGPTTKLTFLGVQIDTVRAEAAIPQEKVDRYRETEKNALKEPQITLKELKSLLGKLQHTCCVILAGRCFLRRLYNLTIGHTQPKAKIYLPPWAKEDLELWLRFLQEHNGRNLYLFLPASPGDTLHIHTDSALGGYGGTHQNHYITGTFPAQFRSLNIAVLELYPIVVLLTILAPSLANHRVTAHTDNQALVFVINDKTSKDPKIMHLLRPLVLTLLKHNICLVSLHIPGKNNTVCDTLSRRQVSQAFLEQHGLDPRPLPVPQSLLPENLLPCATTSCTPPTHPGP